MNDNENKTNNVKKFINEHKTGLIIGACGIVTLALGAYCYRSGYHSGTIDQYKADVMGFEKQFNGALKTLDDETKVIFVEAFNAAASTTSNNQ